MTMAAGFVRVRSNKYNCWGSAPGHSGWALSVCTRRICPKKEDSNPGHIENVGSFNAANDEVLLGAIVLYANDEKICN
jgi:hypothetical protein